MLGLCPPAHRRKGCLAALLAVGLLPYSSRAASSIPPALASATAIVTLTSSEIESLQAGRPVTKLLDGATDDMVIFGAVWIDAPARDYLQAIRDVEHLDCGGGFVMTKRMSDPPTLDDFSAMSLPDGDVKDLRSCRPGNCGVKLTAPAMEMLTRDVDWSSPAAVDVARALIRRMALSIVTDYMRDGSSALQPSLDESQRVVPDQALSEIGARMPVLSRGESDLRRFLREYPNGRLPTSTSYFYWQVVQFGLKPTITVNHVVTAEPPDHIVVASRQLYASHYFVAAAESRHLIPDPQRGRGFWLIDVSGARVDGLGSALGSLLRGRVHSDALSGLAEGLVATKVRMEAPQRARCPTGVRF